MARRVIMTVRDEDGIGRGSGRGKTKEQAEVAAAWAFVSWMREINEMRLEICKFLEAGLRREGILGGR